MAPEAAVVNAARSGNGEERRRYVFPRPNLRNKLTALVVDNGNFCRMVEEGYLKALGAETAVVATGKAAIDLIASGANFNLILIDSVLPVLSSYEVMRQMRGMGVSCGKLIAMGEQDQMEALLAAGADQFVEKPVTPEFLASVLIDLDANLN